MIPKRLALHCAPVLAIGMALLVTTGGGARAATWYQSFDPTVLGPLALPGRTRIVVVAAGPRSAPLEGARLALVAALTASGKWTLADGGQRREMDPDLEDADLVELERDARDVEAIWILRQLPGAGADGPVSASITIYTPLGTLLHALHVIEGQPMLVDASEPDPAAEYLRQRISPVVDRVIVTSPSPEVFSRDGGFAKDGVRLGDAREFYVAVGRHDLLRRYDSVSDARFVATVVSGTVIFVGAIMFMQDVFSEGGQPGVEIGTLGISGVIAGGVGTLGLVITRLIDPDPLDWRGKVEMAAKYNTELRTRLAAPATGAPGAPDEIVPSEAGPRVTIAVSPLSDGLALTLGGAF